MRIAILNTLQSSPSVIPPKGGDSTYTFWLAYYCNSHGANARIFSVSWKDEIKEFLGVTEQIVKGIRMPPPKTSVLKLADRIGYPIPEQSFSQFLLGCNFHMSKSIGEFKAEDLTVSILQPWLKQPVKYRGKRSH